MTFDNQQLAATVASACGGLCAPSWSIADRAYAMPTRHWILGAYRDALASLQFQFGVNHWTVEDNDCDDFARLAAAFAQVLHVNTPGHPGATALAFGEFWYVQDGGAGGHAINVAVCGPDVQDVLFLEPQTGVEKHLSASEKASVTMIRF